MTEVKNVPPQSNGWAEYNALVDRILKGTSYSHIDDWLASRDALVGEVEPVAWMDPRSTDEELAFSFTGGIDRCVPIYTAEALAAAHAKGREKGLREALERAYKDVLLDRNELQRTAFDLTNKIFTAEMNLDQK